ncbi:unnamed protein product [Cladocopium goreaui]|uniref:C2H2-type domain-containing protein n=1 Tax=Cladocopium goreaui TaxID=2562237 RepID=A0A9P1CIT9_9DINO|nr:unnamed protein product [Cladocopium goreaui]
MTWQSELRDGNSAPKGDPAQAFECCTSHCVQTFLTSKARSEYLDETLEKFSKMTDNEVNAFLIGLLGRCDKVGGRTKYALCGFGVCRDGFAALMRINKKRVQRLLSSGGVEVNQVPVDRRKFNGPKQCPKTISADAFFNHYYHNVAEPLAETPAVEDDPYVSRLHCTGPVTDDAPPSLFGLEPKLSDKTCAKANAVTGSGHAGLMGGKGALQCRHVHHMTMEAWYHIYCGWCDSNKVPPEERASNRTFRIVYDQTWKVTMPMREISQHARCSQCAHFTARIGHVHTADEKAALEHCQNIHLSNVRAYRTLQARLATLSEQSTVVDATETCLMISVDGLDQAKTRWPRNLSSSKSLDKLWRPQVHLIGYICHGVCEGFFVVPADVPNDSSCEITVIETILDWAHDILRSRKCSMPTNLVLETDNCAREGKNSIVAKWSCQAVAKGKFLSVSHIYGEVGHTHGPVDQRLSIAVSAFSNEDTIQTPGDFLKILDTKVSPVKGRELKNGMLEGTWDYKTWVEQLGLQISGLVPNARAVGGDEHRVNHSWRFIRRCDLPKYDQKTGESWAPLEIEGLGPGKELSYTPCDHDVIFLAKELVNSNELSQRPLVALPKDFLAKLKEPLKLILRNPIPERSLKEFLKTARVIEQEPWYLLRAAEELRHWIDMNQKKSWPVPHMPVWMHQADTRPVGVEPNPTGWEKFAPGPVCQIQVVEQKPPAEPKPKRQPKRAEPKEACEPKKRGRPRKHPILVPNAAAVPDQLSQGGNGVDAANAEVGPGAGIAELPQVDQGEGVEGVVGVGGAAPAEGAAPDAVPVADDRAKVYGCPRCYFSPKGCSTCRRPEYKPRKPKAMPKAKQAPKAAAAKSTAKKVMKTPGRGKKPGRSVRAKS